MHSSVSSSEPADMDPRTAPMIMASHVREEGELRHLLQLAGLPVSPFYTSEQVMRILCVSKRTLRRMVDEYEEDLSGRPLMPMAISAQLLHTEMRIAYAELCRWLRRNRSWTRKYGEGA